MMKYSFLIIVFFCNVELNGMKFSPTKISTNLYTTMRMRCNSANIHIVSHATPAQPTISDKAEIAHDVKKITRENGEYVKYICLKTFTSAYSKRSFWGDYNFHCSLAGTLWSSSECGNYKYRITDEDTIQTIFEQLEKRFEGKK